MASSRITCPDCKSVLKPAKPVPDGKKVKCPKCGNFFTAPGLVADEPKRKPASAKPAKAAVQKAAAPKPPPPKPVDDDEDEGGGGIYGYVQESGDGEEENDERKINYNPDMSIKDLRGPAQAAIVKPSNYLMLIGGLCCLFDILIICVSFWPMVFSEHLIDHEEFLEKHHGIEKKKTSDEPEGNPLTSRAAAPEQTGKKVIPKERKDLDKADRALLEEAEAWGSSWPYIGRNYRFINIGVFILLFLYNGTTVIGAVKMQNMESRGWGIASSIMTMLPFGAVGIGVVVAFLFYLLFAMVLDDESMGWMYAGGTAGIVWVVTIIAGAYALRTLLSQEVIDGFEYVAE